MTVTNLSGWDSLASEQLDRLRSGTDQQMLRRLLETSCLLELSKLSPMKLDLGAYASAVIEVVSQFFPVDGALFRLEVPGVPPMSARFGDVDDGEADRLWQELAKGSAAAHQPTSHAAAVGAGHDAVGMLAFWHRGEGIEPDEFLATAAAQLTDSLTIATEAEQLRRRSATETATRLAAAYDERAADDHFDQLAEALAALPGVTGASVALRSPVFDPPMTFAAGLIDGPHHTNGCRSWSADGELSASLTWAGTPDPTGLEHLDSILDTLAMSLERADRNRRLVEEAETDPLTGLANRRRISRQLAAAVNRAQRYGEPVALCALDLDFFKRINDEHGHDVGDAVLQTVAEILGDEGRSYDLPARLGGDEFVVLLPATDLLGALTYAHRIVARVETDCAAQLPVGAGVTASVGVAVYPEHGDYAEALLRCADEALYAAKRGGKNQVVPYERTEDDLAARH